MENIYYEVAKGALGYPGKMISGSKSFYSRTFPDHVVVFNANLFVGKTKIWYGDIDVTESLETLKDLASAIGEKLYVLFESDGRFDKEKNPYLDNAVVVLDPSGDLELHPRLVERINEGSLKL
jgi:hypothetical protein